MREENLLQHIQRLEGKLLATQAAIRALICCHPDPERAIETVCRHLDTYAGIAIAGDWPDPLADALASAQNALIPTQEEVDQGRSSKTP